MRRVVALLATILILGVADSRALAQDGERSPAAAVAALPRALKPGDVMTFGADANGGLQRLTVWTLDDRPVVQTELSRRLLHTPYDDKALEKLRIENRLDDVVAAGRTDFERLLLLMEWANSQIEYGDPVGLGDTRDPLEILRLSRRGIRLYCENFAALMLAAAESLGYVVRPVDVPGHSFVEVWSSDYGKWVAMDPTSHWYAEKAGLPLSAGELRAEWFSNQCKDVEFYRGRDRRRIGGRSLHKYHMLYYVLDRRHLGYVMPERQALVFRDEQSKGKTPAGFIPLPNIAEAYYPVQQVALRAVPLNGNRLRVRMATHTPDFKTFRVRLDGGHWRDVAGEEFEWPLERGRNLLEAVAVNRAGVSGTISTIEVSLEAVGARRLVIPAGGFSGQGGGAGVQVLPRERMLLPSLVEFWNTPGHWLEWTVKAAEAGDYELHISYATLFNPRRQLSINGQVVEGLEDFSVAPTGGWLRVSRSRLPARIPLKAGRNVLRMTSLDATNLSLGRLRLSRDNAADIVIEAVDIAAEGGGKAQRTLSPEYGFVRFWTDVGHWMEWTVDDLPAGRYQVLMQYATLYDAPRMMRVNGETAGEKLHKFSLPTSGGWDRFVESPLPAPITLKEGTNILHLASLGGRGLNMANLKLISDEGREHIIPAVSMSAEGGGGGTVDRLAPPPRRAVSDFSRKGQYLEWTVDVPADGNYQLALRYSSGRSRSAVVALSVDGSAVKSAEQTTLPGTGFSGVWEEAEIAAVKLPAGRHVLRLTHQGGGSLRLDELYLTTAQAADE